MLTKKTYKEFSDHMRQGNDAIRAVCGFNPVFDVLIDSICALEDFKRHPRLAYKNYLEDYAKLTNTP